MNGKKGRKWMKEGREGGEGGREGRKGDRQRERERERERLLQGPGQLLPLLDDCFGSISATYLPVTAKIMIVNTSMNITFKF